MPLHPMLDNYCLMSRKCSGRKRIAMAKMEKKSNLQVTFSKRRAGLFKKASELCTLTGAKVGILVFSPGKKVFSFGHPGVVPIIDRFLSGENTEASDALDPTQQFVEAYQKENVRDLNVRLSHMLHELEIEKKRGEELTRMKKLAKSRGLNWWESPNEELTWPQLEALKASLEQLKRNVLVQKETLNLHQTSYHQLPPPSLVQLPPIYYASTSPSVNGQGLNGCFSQPLNLNAPYLDSNFSVGNSSANVNCTGYPRGYYME